MEWVVTTASTIEGAQELALDELGVDASEAEFQVLQEPSKGFVGIGAKQARIQARIVPNVPRAKQERRPRRNKRTKQDDRSSSGDQPKRAQKSSSERGSAKKKQDQSPKEGSKRPSDARSKRNSNTDGSQSGKSGQTKSVQSRGTQPKVDQPKAERPKARDTKKSREQQRPQEKQEARVEDPMTLEEQGEVALAFLTGMRDQMGLTGDVVKRDIDEDNLEVAIDGDGLGLLVGPKGQTLHALQEVTKTVLQRKAVNGARGRIRVDVGGYREHRREALIAFTIKVADEVRESGDDCSLEPMIASERKIVHDTVNDLDGVGTISEGTDPRRRVVIVPS